MKARSTGTVQLVMTIEEALRIRGGSAQPWSECAAALVRPDAPHAVDARQAMVLIAFVDPESQLGAALSARMTDDVLLVPKAEVARWRSAIGTGNILTEARVQVWLRDVLLNGQAPVKVHPAVNRVLRYLRAQTSGLTDVSLPTLAAVAGLSESRFMHVFTESTGVALRPYILWLRVQRACGALMRGDTDGSCAPRGFSDAAHLARTFRRMLGVTPTEIAARKRLARGVSLQAD